MRGLEDQTWDDHKWRGHKGSTRGVCAWGKLELAVMPSMIEIGRVAERFNVPDSKSGVGATLPWVQIPPRPSLRGRGKPFPPGGVI